MSAAVAVTNTCPACDAPLVYVYAFARAYLCVTHRAAWDVADERAHRHNKLCPHFPKPCERCAENEEFNANLCPHYPKPCDECRERAASMGLRMAP